MGNRAENQEFVIHREGCCRGTEKPAEIFFQSGGMTKKRMEWKTEIDLRPDFSSIHLLKVKQASELLVAQKAKKLSRKPAKSRDKFSAVLPC